MKRFSDFQNLYAAIRSIFSNQGETPISRLPDFPPEESFGFRRGLAALGMSNFMNERRQGLQQFLNQLFDQVEVVEDEPALAQFFGPNAIPKEGKEKEASLRARWEQLVTFHKDQALEAQLKKATQEVLRQKRNSGQGAPTASASLA